jgi:MFS family permease
VGPAGCFSTSRSKIVTDRFAGKEISTAIGFMLATFPLGVALAMATLGGVAVAASWQVAVLVPVGATVVILVVVALLYRDRPVQVPMVPLERPPLWVITTRELGLVLVAGATFALLNVAWIVFLSFTPTLLLGRGLSEAQAAGLTSWASWLTIGSAAAGYVLDRTRRVTVWLVLAALVNAAVCLFLPLFGPPLLWIALLGLATAPLVVGIVALPAEVLRPESRASGFGAFFTINYLGFALLPPVAGYLLDVTRSTAAPIWFSGALWLGIVLALLLFRWLQHRGRERRPGPASLAC